VDTLAARLVDGGAVHLINGQKFIYLVHLILFNKSQNSFR
jgi:hypothetical protein